MKRLAIAMMAMGLAVMLALPMRASAQGSDTLAVVDAYMAALSAKDVDAALVLIDDNIVQTYNPFPPPGLSRVNRGKETFRGLLQGFTADLIKIERLAQPRVDGNTVALLDRVHLQSLRNIGVDYTEEFDEFVVVNGKITSITVTLTNETVARLPPAPNTPAAMPKAGYGDRLHPRLWMFALGGLGLASLGLILRRHARRARLGR